MGEDTRMTPIIKYTLTAFSSPSPRDQPNPQTADPPQPNHHSSHALHS